ncbi:DinB family protein [Sphingobacterium bovistauri]|uniref:DinB family protein n=1 Tax=Sphingobacterium bovistauri TaxID=2781959 RepID=A0ABS7Z0V5_9SPHI|nr:DinB family protein [Sphingobacterium bovistauri]MCA5003793.1 DinB family protein [Sphingobacterium bovistauri]
MEQVFKFIIDARKAFIKDIESLSLEQLNEIPTGFNNNIIWNFGHIVVTTPILCYVRSGIWADASQVRFAAAYAKGTKPTYFVTQEEVEALKALAISSIQAIEADYKAGKLSNITPFETSTYGATLNSIEDIIITTAGHDNTHLGYVTAQKRIINK